MDRNLRYCMNMHVELYTFSHTHTHTHSHSQYFKNVLFEYMMGRQTDHLVKVIAALARFSDKQKRKLFEKY